MDCNLIFRKKRASEEEIFEYYRDSYYREWGEDQEGCVRETIYLDALRFMEQSGYSSKILFQPLHLFGADFTDIMVPGLVLVLLDTHRV